MRRIGLAVAALVSVVACASAPLPQEVAAPLAVTIKTQASAAPPRAAKCESPGTIEHVVVKTQQYRENTCVWFMPAFDEFVQVGCADALPELAAAVSTLSEIMTKMNWYSVSVFHKVSKEHADARLRVASIAWSMMPARCQGHVPKPMNGDDTDMSIADVDPSWRDCYPDAELALAHFDFTDIGKVTLLAYVFAVALEPYMTSVGAQFLRQALYCNTTTKTHADELAFRAFGW